MPSKSLRTEVLINAPPEAVWAILTDFENYPQWNKFISGVDAAQGLKDSATIRPKLTPAGRGSLSVKAKVCHVVPGQEFGFKGAFPIPGMFKGEKRFRVEPAEGGCKFINTTYFAGLLTPLLGSVIRASEKSMEETSAALKARAEAPPAPPPGQIAAAAEAAAAPAATAAAPVEESRSCRHCSPIT